MNNHTTLTTLFATLQDTLPYEYDRLYATDINMEHGIMIYRKDSERTIYITLNTPDDNGIVDTSLYDGTLIETIQWDTDDLNLIDFITYIENNL